MDSKSNLDSKNLSLDADLGPQKSVGLDLDLVGSDSWPSWIGIGGPMLWQCVA